jgi:hypothetical protein
MGNISLKDRLKRMENQLVFHKEMENKSMISNLESRIEILKNKLSKKV